ncbi:MAG TPA: DUF4344 domain-containing metallopeptidase [Allocoleopsis sp.]
MLIKWPKITGAIASFLMISTMITSMEIPAVKAQESSSLKQTIAQRPRIKKVKKNGKFKVIYHEVSNPEYQELREALAENKLFDILANVFNEILVLPQNVTVNVTECGEANAFYSPKQKAIFICYELMEDFANDFKDSAESEEELMKNVLYTTTFVFYHEAGHALIDILDLPVTGKEEDAADQLATFILTLGGDDGEEIALSAIKQFQIASERDDNKNLWDEHSLDEQRFYNLLCLLYGSNPEKYSDVVTDEILPESRAEGCSAEYEKVSKSWLKLLKPHMKKQYQ